MKIALVSYDVFQGQTTGLYPPLHLCALATALRDAGHEARVFDYAGPLSGIDAYFRSIRSFAPRVIGLTCYTPYIAAFYRLTRELKVAVPDAVMVAGGPHPTVWPEWTLERMPHIDYAMQGECDRSIVLFAEMIAGSTPASGVPGLVYRDGRTVVKSEPARIDHLDELSQVDRGFLDDYYRAGMYWDMAARNPLDMMITSRGCPYDCSFCFKTERRYRFRGVGHVMAEFEILRRRGVRSVHIQDDAFTANRKRCSDIADALIGGGYRFELKVRSRVNSVDEDLLCKLKKAGVREIIYGFESGSQAILDSMNKRTTVEMNERAIRLTKKAGITCYGEIMIGMPGETRQTLDETLQFLLKNKPIVGFIPVLYPLPSTRVYEEARTDGTLQGDWTVDGPWPWVKLPWTASRDDLVAASKRISRAVQRDPGTILYFLRHHLGKMGWRQISFLMRLARDLHFAPR